MQPAGGFFGTAAPAAASRHARAGHARPDDGDVSGKPRGARNERGADDRDSVGGARGLRALPSHAAVARRAAREGAADARAHLLQIRGRQPRRQPQAQHRDPAGLLQQNCRHQAPRHRNRRGPVGLVAGVCVQRVWTRVQHLHGEGELPPEALPPAAHADLRRHRARQPEPGNGIRPQGARRRIRTATAAAASRSARRSRTR